MKVGFDDQTLDAQEEIELLLDPRSESGDDKPPVKRRTTASHTRKTKAGTTHVRRSAPATYDLVGERNWKALKSTYRRTIQINDAQIIAQLVIKFQIRLIWSARVRIEKAKSVPQDMVVESEYILLMWQLYSRLDVDTHVKWILAHMPVQIQAVCGRKIETEKEFLDIPKTWKTMSDLEDYLCYHITGIDKAGNVVVHCSGSAAARKGSGGKDRSSVSFFFFLGYVVV